MKPLRKRFIVAAALLGIVATGAIASRSEACEHGPWASRQQAMHIISSAWSLEAAPGQGNPQRLAEQLKLKPDQQAAWDAYVATLGNNKADKDSDKPSEATTTPERLARALVTTQAREQRASARLEAMKTLYAQLTPEQRTTFDQAQRPFFGHHWKHNSQ